MTSLPTRSQVPGARPEPQPQLRPTQLRDALMQAPALICLTRGPRHVIEAVNTLYSQSIGGRDVVGLSMREAFPESSLEQMTALDDAYHSGEPSNTKVAQTVHRDSGEERFFNLVVQPLRDNGGKVYGLMTFAVDVTEHVRAQQELTELALALERTNHELDSFAYAASHDLRAPLRGIANLAQWIEEDLVSTGQLRDETREMLELMRGRMHRMEGLIEGLLEYSRAGRIRHAPETVDIGDVVDDVIDLLSPPETVSIHIGPDFPTISTERLLVQQVLMNLIGNAIKHADRKDAAIEVTSQRVGQFYEFSVRDNGPGIPPEYHDRIWGIFQTLEARDRVEGAGIGLALVKKIVESQGGRVWVESAPGKGATFRFLWRK